MTLTLKSILVVILIAALQGNVFSQEQSPAALYASGESLLHRDFEKGFEMIGNAVEASLETGDFSTYLKCVDKLMSLDYYDRDNQAEMVLRWLDKSGTILKDKIPSEQTAQFYFRSATFYGDYSQQTTRAINHFEKAKEIWISLRGSRDADVAACYHSLGDIYKYTTFDFRAAEKSYETALTIREEIKLHDPVVLYRNYYSLAATNGSQRDFEKALSYANKAEEIVRSLEPRRQEQCAAMIANIYRDMGRTDLAKNHYLKALSLNKLTQDLDNKAWYYQCLGEMFKYEMLTQEALGYYQKAYELYKLPGSRDQALFLSLLIGMFDIYSASPSASSSERNVNNTQNFYKVRKEIFQELSSSNMLHSTEAANAWLVIGKYHAGKSAYDSALIAYQQALIASVPAFKSQNVLDNPTEDMIGFQYYVNEILTQKASALKSAFEKTRDIQFLNRALDCLELAEQLLSKQRNTLDMEDSKWLFLEENFDLYETIIEYLYQAKGSVDQDTIQLRAFEYFERSKARSLADALTLAERSNQFDNQDTLLQVQADLKRRLLSAQAKVTRGLEKSVDPEELSDYRNEIVELDRQIQAVKLDIEEKYPGYFNVKYGYHTIPFTKVTSLLKENDQVLLEYFWGTNGVYALSVMEHETVFQRIGSPDSIKNLINTLLLHLTVPGSSTDMDRFNQFRSSAFDLYTILVKPFAATLKNHQRIQIIPDGPISQVPFEILLSEPSNVAHVDYRSLKYLIKSFAIGYAYSSSSMLNRDVSSRNVSSPSMLAMGFTDGRILRDGETQLSQIVGAEEELHALAQRFSSGKFLFGKDAHEANFKRMAPEYDILHLAVHGSGDVEKNFAASLYFGKSDNGEDGELHAYELYGLKLNALMAVLSSCESGLGKGYRGEGMISMASAFTYSGCQNILMSLWKVNDQTAMTLMDDFYGFLLAGETIDVALRHAKLKYLEAADEFSADPRTWTPLVAYGNLNQIFRKDINNVLVYGGIVLISAIAFVFWKIIKSKAARA